MLGQPPTTHPALRIRSFYLTALLLCLCLFFLLLPNRVSTQVETCVQPPSGTVAWWPLDETSGTTAEDIIGNNPGSYVNGPVAAAGNVAGALSFDGVDDFVLVPHSADLNFAPHSSLTIEAWAFRTSSAPVMHLVGKRQGCGGDSDFYQLAIGPNAVPSDAVPLNTWTHIAVTYDGETSTQRQYVNGSLVLTTGQTVGSNTAPLKVGNSGTCTPFGGLIDEVTIYNRTLSTLEIQGIYDASSAGKCKSSVQNGPVSSNVMANPNPVDPSVPVALTATVSDAATGGSNVAAAEYNVNGGAFIAMNPADGAFDQVTENVTATVPPFSTAGLYTLCVRGTDADGNVGASKCINVDAEICVQPPSGIIVWWPFDETSGTTAQDVVGGLNGVHVNGPVPTPGKVGGALRFNGSSSYVGAPDSDLWAFGTGNFTVELWANFDAPSSGDIVHPGDVFISSDDGPGTQNKWIFALGGGLLELIVVNTADLPPNFFLVRAPFSPVVGEWYHLAVTKTATLFTIYVNGVEVGSEVSTPPIANANAPLIIGQSNEPFGGFMNGLLDEVTIYNRALTQGELQAIFNAGSAGKCKALSLSTKALSAIQLGTFSTQRLQALFGSAPFNWSLVNGDLPAGVTLTSDGILSGTPTVAGSFPVTIRVTDTFNAIAEKNFSLEVLLTLPPADIRIQKTGTVVVPGRIVDYFVLVENKGNAVATNVEVVEILEPPAFFSLVSTTPAAQVSDESLVYWEIPFLQPGETKLFSYSVRLNPSVPLGTIVSGQACAKETGKSREQILQRIPKCTLLPQCAILFDKNAGEFALCNVAKETCDACDKFCTTIAGIKFCLSPLYGACLAQCALKVSICVQALMDCQPACFPAKCPAEAQTALAANGLQCALCPSGCSCDDRPARGAVDPNEKEVIAKRFIQPDQLLVYPIHFENIGTVEARDVFVTDLLDPNLDASTLNVLTPTGGSFDVATRTVSWGLLNRNLEPGETDNVLLSIRPRPGLPSGTVIRNRATIQFEVFQPIVTNEVVNIIDSTRPTSVVNPLPAETSTLDFPISWTGSDAVGEIDFYSILVSVDGGSFTPFLERTRETSATFRGEVGKTYGFIAIATDTAGNIEVQDATAEASTRVIAADCATGGDTEPPTITAPPAVTLYTGPGATSCGVTVNDLDTTLGVASASDNCPGVTVARSGVPAGNFFPVGQTTITYIATDTGGNTAMATQTVTVIDNTRPTITAESVSPASLWPPNHTMRDVNVNYTAVDNCSSNCTLSVTSNEPVNGTGDGDTAPDWEIVDAHHVRLRAERAGHGTGRTYTITISCIDSAGNSSTKIAKVLTPVSHDQSWLGELILLLRTLMLRFVA